MVIPRNSPFDQPPHRLASCPLRLERDILSFNSALAACAGNLQWDQVLVLLSALASSGLQGNALTHGILAGCNLPSLGSLEALQSAGLQQMAKERSVRWGVLRKLESYNTLVLI